MDLDAKLAEDHVRQTLGGQRRVVVEPDAAG
jgi:hypothetical protein